ncbi:D-alanyl-lipoteichoic acid acyltransferase DltB, MBOAT superfamily [Butyrivibrio sp. ob235]|uniref:MBOAT family O-acyltransferase n=1 Tax=Butyrivibrio sp. ob235 TaxID=1761780 RepID=UPI0008C324B0|nr:MBOAT family O-acyltransferase [Butyrivibrio sp. ob235]SEK85151.1 D-alanyl-lipoteichoic acid acyltransferase DltB, MBOAT superfamily [Butyrivibrio sp. ob235]
MQLISIQFLIFLPVMAFIYFLLPEKVRYIWLFLISWAFYLSLDLRGFPVLLFTSVSTYVGGRLLEKLEGGKKKAVLAVVICANLLVLALSKYTGLTFLSAAGMSFFMFMAIGYLVDVYRGDLYAEKNFLLLSLFISFFPQVTSGPIERAGHMLRQFRTPQNFSYDRMRDGLLQMMWGYFMKMVIADRCAILVSSIYADPVKYAGTATLIASILYTFEIYCDFGGYSNIAIGCAKVLGFDLMKNFDAPYTSATVQEFWRRWHISLSSWFKDYLYIPLGGNRKGTVRKYINILIVFVLSGLWHGATYTFAIWGLLHGIYQVLGHVLKPLRDRLCDTFNVVRNSFSHRLLKTLITFMLVNIAWIFFRVQDFASALYMVFHIWKPAPWFISKGTIYELGLDRPNVLLLLMSIGLLIGVDIANKHGIKVAEKITTQGIWLRWLIYIAAVTLIVTCGIWGPGYDAAGFIYQNF